MAERTRLSPALSHQTSGPNLFGIDLFDVPAEDYIEGHFTGIKAAWELLQAAERDDLEGCDPAHVIRCSIEAAVHVIATPRSANGIDRAGAAVGFLDALCSALATAVTQWDFRSVLEEHLETCLAGLLERAEERLRDSQAFVQGMAAAPVTRSEVSHV